MDDDLSADDAVEPPPTFGTMLKRGCRKKCPRCGGGHLYRGWFRMHDRCPTCGVKFEREPGFFVSAAFVNFAITEGMLFLVMMGLIAALGRNPDAGLLVPLSIGGALAALCPIVFYPFSRTIWSAIDMAMMPLELPEIIAARDFLAIGADVDEIDETGSSDATDPASPPPSRPSRHGRRASRHEA